jgi:signal transduction histidine kinase
LRGPAELRRVSAAFNDMAERLTRLLRERAQMLAAIGHDLRSPVTAMRLRLEMLDDEEARERIGASVDEIETLVEAALALARGGGADQPRETVDLATLLGEIVAGLHETGADVTLDAPDPVTVYAAPAALRRALRNVAENAVRYGDRARIRLRATPGTARIEIADDGPGIPPAERERVFEPFVRLETSRSRETGGSGLGLAIARAAIDGHGGTIAFTEAEGGGACAVITLPRP